MVTITDQTAGPLSHDRFWQPGVVQAACPEGVLDLERGYLGPALLPVDMMLGGYCRALADFGSASLAYGDNKGALALRVTLAARSAAADKNFCCGPEHVLVTAGTSQALHLIVTTFADDHDVVLVDQVCYDLGRRILRDGRARLREVPSDSQGMEPAALDEALRGSGHATAFIYLNPTFHNPTGIVMPAARRRELLAVAAAHDTLIVEDDAYCDLAFGDIGSPPSLAGLAEYRGVIRLRTFSKSLAPGLRLGWLEADPAVTGLLARRGILDSGGCLNHAASLAVLALLQQGDYDRHLVWLRAQLKARQRALVAALRGGLPDRFEFAEPDGGFFLWIGARRGGTEAELLSAAGRAGLRVAAGSRFGSTSHPCVRLSYSFHEPGQLARAGQQLAAALSGGPA